MDPLSIAASAAGIVALIGTVTDSLSRFVADVSNIDKAVDDFKQSMSGLRTVLSSVEATFNSRPEQYDFERKHWDDIRRILEACNQCVYRLNNEMPQFQPGKGIAHRAYHQLVSYAKSNVVATLRSHIAQYSQCLMVSMSAINIVSHWKTQSSQDAIKHEIGELRMAIKNATFMTRTLSPPPAAAGRDSADTLDLNLGEIDASRNIEKWYGSAETVAFSISQYQPDQLSVAERRDQRAARGRDPRAAPKDGLKSSEVSDAHPMIGSNGKGNHRDSGVDMESDLESLRDLDPDLDGCLPQDMMTNEIEENQRFVQEKLDAEYYCSAESDQRLVIDLYEKREKVYGIAFTNRDEQEEILATIYLRLSTPKALNSAKKIVHGLLQRDRENPTNASRRPTLYHSLALIYDAQGEPRKAKTCALGALKGRRESASEDEATQDTLKLLVRLYRQLGEHASVIAVQKEIQADTPPTKPFPPPPVPEEKDNAVEDTNVWKWLQDNRFETVDNVDANDDDNTPLHHAIKIRNIDIVRALLEAGASRTLEVKNSTGSTPLLLAAATRHKGVVSLLLSQDADVTATDNWGNSALHRVQHTSGGVQVAELLLSHSSPIDVNIQNDLRQTPLHRAVRFGNQEMVHTLLEASANPSAQDHGGTTPLHVAVEYRREDLVPVLLDAGADIHAKDLTGLTPVEAAQRSHPALPHARALLEQVRRERSGSSGSSSSIPPPPTTRRTSSMSTSSPRSLSASTTATWASQRSPPAEKKSGIAKVFSRSSRDS